MCAGLWCSFPELHVHMLVESSSCKWGYQDYVFILTDLKKINFKLQIYWLAFIYMHLNVYMYMHGHFYNNNNIYNE